MGIIRRRGASADQVPGNRVSRKGATVEPARRCRGRRPTCVAPDALEPRAEGIHSQGRWRVREEVPPQLGAGEFFRLIVSRSR